MAGRIATILLCTAHLAFAQTATDYYYNYGAHGTPPISQFLSQDYHAHAQNWAIAQDHRGIMYFGNRSGILEFDGSTWRTIPIFDNQAIPVRSLTCDASGKLLVGADGYFGYLAPDPTGSLKFVSLNNHIPRAHRQLSDVWHAHGDSAANYFLTANRLFVWANGKMVVSKSNSAFQNAFVIEDRLFLIEHGVGLIEVAADTLKTISTKTEFSQSEIFAIMPFESSDTSLQKEPAKSLLIADRQHGLLLFKNGEIQKFPTNVNGALLEGKIYGGIRLDDGNFALATLNRGIIIIDREGQKVGAFTSENGLNQNRVHALFQDREQALWLALNDGIARIDISSQLAFYSDPFGLSGNIHSSLQTPDGLYATSSDGLFLSSANRVESITGQSIDSSIHFVPIQGIRGASYDILSLENGLLITGQEGIHHVENSNAEKIANEPGKLLHRSAHSSELIYATQRDQLVLLQQNEETKGWSTHLTGIHIRNMTTIADDGHGSVWISSATDGVYEITASPQSATFPTLILASYDTSDGLPGHDNNRVHTLFGNLVFTRLAGIYEFKPELKRFVPHWAFTDVFEEQKAIVLDIAEDSNGQNCWLLSFMNGQYHLAKYERGPEGKYLKSSTEHVSFEDIVVNQITSLSDGTSLLSTNKGLVQRNAVQHRASRENYSLLRRVTNEAGTLIFGGSFRGREYDQPETFKTEMLSNTLSQPGEQSLSFEFSSPIFDTHTPVYFRTYLQGYDPEWSPWEPNRKRNIENIPPGEYRFLVQMKTPSSSSSPSSFYDFEVLPPVHATWWAKIMYGLISAVCIMILGLVIKSRLKEVENLVSVSSSDTNGSTGKRVSRLILMRFRHVFEFSDRLSDKLRRELLSEPDPVSVQSMDEVLLTDARKIIEQHLDDESFTVQQLASELGMTRANLHRRLKILLGQSPSLFIRSVRLKRAAQLLRNNGATISEIAYAVGFSSPAYFSKCFQLEYGLPPSAYQKGKQLT